MLLGANDRPRPRPAENRSSADLHHIKPPAAGTPAPHTVKSNFPSASCPSLIRSPQPSCIESPPRRETCPSRWCENPGPSPDARSACTKYPAIPAETRTQRTIHRQTQLPRTAFPMASTVIVRLANPFTIGRAVRHMIRNRFVVENVQNPVFNAVFRANQRPSQISSTRSKDGSPPAQPFHELLP